MLYDLHAVGHIVFGDMLPHLIWDAALPGPSPFMKISLHGC